MVIFHCYVSSPEGKWQIHAPSDQFPIAMNHGPFGSIIFSPLGQSFWSETWPKALVKTMQRRDHNWILGVMLHITYNYTYNIIIHIIIHIYIHIYISTWYTVHMYIYVHRPSSHVFSIHNRFGIPGRYRDLCAGGYRAQGNACASSSRQHRFLVEGYRGW